MSREEDINGLRVKPGHTGLHGHDIGDWVWLIRRHDDALIGPYPDRHTALGAREKLHGCDDYELVPIRAGTFRFDDVRVPETQVIS